MENRGTLVVLPYMCGDESSDPAFWGWIMSYFFVNKPWNKRILIFFRNPWKVSEGFLHGSVVIVSEVSFPKSNRNRWKESGMGQWQCHKRYLHPKHSTAMPTRSFNIQLGFGFKMFQIFSMSTVFHPYLGRRSNLINMFHDFSKWLKPPTSQV